MKNKIYFGFLFSLVAAIFVFVSLSGRARLQAEPVEKALPAEIKITLEKYLQSLSLGDQKLLHSVTSENFRERMSDGDANHWTDLFKSEKGKYAGVSGLSDKDIVWVKRGEVYFVNYKVRDSKQLLIEEMEHEDWFVLEKSSVKPSAEPAAWVIDNFDSEFDPSD